MARALDSPSGFYVYQLVDPRSGLAFYVGKGQGARAWQHEKAVLAGNLTGNQRKIAAISAILASGGSVEVKIVASYHDEADALDHEYRLVDANPTLTNVLPGGIGKTEDPARAQKRLALQVQRMAERRRQRLEEARERDAVRRKSGIVERARTSSERVEIEKWCKEVGADRMTAQMKPLAERRKGVGDLPAPPKHKRRRGKFGRYSSFDDYQRPQPFD